MDDRARPQLCRDGKGEQGVLNCEPYKGELVPLWRSKTPEIAKAARLDSQKSSPPSGGMLGCATTKGSQGFTPADHAGSMA